MRVVDVSSPESWDNIWMTVAEVIATKSWCVRAQVGAVIVTPDNRIVATGYNGPPAGMLRPSARCDAWCPRARGEVDVTSTHVYGLTCPTVHAEANALLWSDRSIVRGGTMYVTHAVCHDCVKLIANSGVAAVVMTVHVPEDDHRRPDETVAFLRNCDIIVAVRTVDGSVR